MNKKTKWYLVIALIVLLLAGGASPALAEEPCDAVCRVEARVAELRAERAIRYAAIRAASEARIVAMLAEIEAERAAWYTGLVATPTPTVVPRYATNPVLISPNPNDVYGNRTKVTTENDIRSQYSHWKPETLSENEHLKKVFEDEHWDSWDSKTGYLWRDRHIAIPTGGEVFRWTWDGTLLANQYFQVQLICPNGSHRGIHPPTKDNFTVQGGGLRYVVQDCKGAKTRAWDHESWTPVRNIPIQWTVVIVQWDGVDPSLIGPTLAEAEPRWLRI